MRLMDEVTAACLAISFKEVVSYKKDIPTCCLNKFEDMYYDRGMFLRDYFIPIFFKLAFMQVYEVIVYAEVMKKLDADMLAFQKVLDAITDKSVRNKMKKNPPNSEKKAMKEYFDKSVELETALEFALFAFST